MWYYLEGNEKKGPFGEEELKGLIQKEVISSQTNVWKQGMSGWKKASECCELTDSLPPPPFTKISPTSTNVVANMKEAGKDAIKKFQQYDKKKAAENAVEVTKKKPPKLGTGIKRSPVEINTYTEVVYFCCF